MIRFRHLITVILALLIGGMLPLHIAMAAEMPYHAVESRAFFDFSADGSHLVLADPLRGEIWLYDLRESPPAPKRLATLRSREDENQSVRVFSPRLSPAGDVVVFVSYDEAQMDPVPSFIWRVNRDGSAFRTLTKSYLDPGRDPLTTPDYLKFFEEGRRVLFPDFELSGQTTTLSSVDLSQETSSSFLWQKGVRFWQWSPDERYLAYLVRKGGLATDSQSMHAEFWMTRADGGQLKKSSQVIFWDDEEKRVPFAWAPHSQWMAFISGSEEEVACCNLQVQNPKRNVATNLLRLGNHPVRNLVWSKSGQKIALLQEGDGQAQVLSLDLKTKRGEVIAAKKMRTFTMPNHSVLLGFDPENEKNLLLLVPERQEQPAYALVRMNRKKKNAKILARRLPSEHFYALESGRQMLIFCGLAAGCQSVDLRTGERQWFTPNFEATIAAGDELLRLGDPQQAKVLYERIGATRLERAPWIGLEVRKVQALEALGDTEKREEVWTHLIGEIDKGEFPARDYLLLARTLASLGRQSEAIEMYGKIQSQYAATLEARDALYESGLVYRRMREFEYARNCLANFAKIYAQDPRSVVALIELGETYLDLDQPAVALRIFRKVIDLSVHDERQVRALLGKGRCLERMSHFKEASKTYELVLDRLQKDKNLEPKMVRSYTEEAERALSRIADG